MAQPIETTTILMPNHSECSLRPEFISQSATVQAFNNGSRSLFRFPLNSSKPNAMMSDDLKPFQYINCFRKHGKISFILKHVNITMMFQISCPCVLIKQGLERVTGQSANFCLLVVGIYLPKCRQHVISHAIIYVYSLLEAYGMPWDGMLSDNVS